MRFAMFVAAILAACTACAADAPDLGETMCLQGTVVEAKDVDTYTYLLVDTRGGEAWAAIDKGPVQAGAEVAIVQAAVMKDFWSRTLQKNFEWIVFGRLAESCEPNDHSGATMEFHHAAVAAPASGAPITVAKADGPDGRTVAEVVAASQALSDRPVAIRGQVVRYTPDVMGKNWIHLRDGSGSATDGSDDIVVTTDAQAEIGEVVLVKGMVRTNRNLGAGYAYKVLVEDATLER
ncbi:MAG TPA: nucleotide-binding protein [Casimicrobiaceae bacterium]|nr:nucleotide-binding protein [Casimicrobiaceae bacterium]